MIFGLTPLIGETLLAVRIAGSQILRGPPIAWDPQGSEMDGFGKPSAQHRFVRLKRNFSTLRFYQHTHRYASFPTFLTCGLLPLDH